jgi:prolyl-tRNA editing enzyme YbaK/EbsC (Cys-tRNA(Pro) deacylase)
VMPMGSKQRVLEFLEKSGVDSEFREFDETTKSSALAAIALGCPVAEIAKSVVFMAPGPLVVVISGDKRVDASKLARVSGGAPRVATPSEVRDATGYPIGGVPPFPHDEGVRVLVDESLGRQRWVWAAAGAPNAVFRIEVKAIVSLTGGGLRDLAEQDSRHIESPNQI